MTLVATTFGFCIACVGSLGASSLFRRLAVAKTWRDLRDLPGERKPHRAARSQIGGLAILSAWMFAVATVVHFFGAVGSETLQWIRGIVPAMVLMACVGLVDDLQSQEVWPKLGGQLLAILLVFLGSPLLHTFSSQPWTLQLMWGLGAGFFALTLTNATNFIDGLDGLAAGVSGASALGLVVLALLLGDETSAVLAACLAGASLGFLRSNVVPARIFLGDTGSLFLGLGLSVTCLRIFSLSPTWSTALALVLLHSIALGDFTFAVLRRGLHHARIWRADEGHIHHRLLRGGMSMRFAVASLWLVAALSGVTGIETFRHGSARVWAAALVLATLPVVWTAWRSAPLLAPRSSREKVPPDATSVLASDRAA